ncbi:MAG: dTDP-4-amino-4,6-dideoxygalactose transaminase [Gammaproteobacteria bacterium GWF2_41_13]|nr:MAG: dTDP-4-amino-4,6-dideoxygalactose transaminase [Gammaproteobacteria bacterium GWF2_41_13]
MLVPFNKPYMSGRELHYIAQAHAAGKLTCDGEFAKRDHAWLEKSIGCKKALLTPSCTAALEMAAILCDIHPGDEIIMPSFTFVSTANAFVLRGGIPVFVDVRSDTLNIDEKKIESAITAKTKAICVVHYAGVGCEMDAIMDIARRHSLFVIEDAAQGILSKFKNTPLGSMGHLAAVSFHETKNIQCGEGGALLINDSQFIKRAEIIREKGTNRSQFFRGEIDKYSWVDVGSSYLPSEITAAFLFAQLEESENITQKRIDIWNTYHDAFEILERAGEVRRPFIPKHCQHNGHIYYLLLSDLEQRTKFIDFLKSQGVNSIFHYVSLHKSIAGEKYAKIFNGTKNTDMASECLVRLPLWMGVEQYQAKIIDLAHKALKIN